MKYLQFISLGSATLAMITPAQAQQPYIGVTGYTLQSEFQFGTATGNNVRSIADLRANFKPNAPWGRINGELQHYTNFLTTTYAGRAPDSAITINRTHQFETEALVLNSNHLGGAYAWGNIESGAIVTNQTVFRPVIVEVLAQLPKGRAHWPAIWMYDLSSGNHNADEIDIMESVFNGNGDTRNHVFQYLHGNYTTVTNYLLDANGRYNAGVDMSLAYHYYTTHWYANGDCDMYVDGIRTIRRNIPWNAAGGYGGHPPNIEINLAITTDQIGWPGPIIAGSGNGTDTFSPDSNSMFKIRHIRIFKPAVADAIIDQTSTAFTYTPSSQTNWETYSDALDYGGSHRTAITSGTSVSISFTGKRAQVMGIKANNRGIVSVKLDGIAKPNIDFYSPTTLYKALLYDTGTLASGAHTIVLAYTGTKNAASSGYRFTMDALTVPALIDQTNAAFTYIPSSQTNWETYSDALDYGGTHRTAITSGTSVTISFTGTRAQVLGLKAKDRGIVSVKLDGVTKPNIDFYSPTTVYQWLAFDTGALTSGTHTIVIAYTGTKNAASSGYRFSMDALMVTP